MRVFALLLLAAALTFAEPPLVSQDAAAQTAIAANDLSQAVIMAADYRASRFSHNRHFSGSDGRHFRHDRYLDRGHRYRHFRGHDRHFYGRDHRYLHRHGHYRHFRGYGHRTFSVCYRSGSLLVCFGG